jgi:hypothetical protein
LPEKINSDIWFSRQEIYHYLSIKFHAIMRWIEQRKMPASKVGKLDVYRMAGIGERASLPSVGGTK